MDWADATDHHTPGARSLFATIRSHPEAGIARPLDGL